MHSMQLRAFIFSNAKSDLLLKGFSWFDLLSNAAFFSKVKDSGVRI